MSENDISESEPAAANFAQRSKVDFAARKKRSDAAAINIAVALKSEPLQTILVELFQIVDLTESRLAWEDFLSEVAVECAQFGYCAWGHVGTSDIFGITRLSSPKALRIKLTKNDQEEAVVAIVVIENANGSILHEKPEDVLAEWRRIEDSELSAKLVDLLTDHVRICQGKLARKPHTDGLNKHFVSTVFGFAAGIGFVNSDLRYIKRHEAIDLLIAETNRQSESRGETRKLALRKSKSSGNFVVDLAEEDGQKLEFKMRLRLDTVPSLPTEPKQSQTAALVSDESTLAEVVPETNGHVVMEVVPETNAHVVMEAVPATNAHAVIEVVPETNGHGPMEAVPETNAHVVMEAVPETNAHAVIEVVPETNGHVAMEAVPETNGHVAMEAVPETNGHVAMEAVPETNGHVAMEAVPETNAHAGNVAANEDLSHTNAEEGNETSTDANSANNSGTKPGGNEIAFGEEPRDPPVEIDVRQSPSIQNTTIPRVSMERNLAQNNVVSTRPLLPELFLSTNVIPPRIHEIKDADELIAGGKTFRELQEMLNDPGGRAEVKHLVEVELELPGSSLMPQILHTARIQAHKGGRFLSLLAIVRALM